MSTGTKDKEEGSDASVVQGDGLRYKRKAVGSPFGAGVNGGLHQTAMSCFKCGRHKPRGELASRRLLGRNQLVCAGGCSTR